jgi:hypothetical protein
MGIAYTETGKDLIPGARSATDEGNIDPEYSTYVEMVATLLELEALYPSIAKVYDIGDALSKSYTWGNYDKLYDIWALRISDNPTVDEPEPSVTYDARHHAREPVSTEVVLAIAEYYCQNYGAIQFVTDTVDNTEIWIIPMVNPDGHQWVEDVDPWWRKTLWDYNENHWVDDNEGIDPNRNYDWHWDLGSWSSATYGGPFPWSAVEIATMRDHHELHRTCINPSYHSYGEVVLYPFGYGVDPEPALLEVVNEFGSYIGYNVQQSSTAHGSSKDWVYGAIGGCSFTVETANEFIPSGTEMLQVVQENLIGGVWLATRARGASIQGTVTDAVTGAPVEATIHIPEIHDVYGNGELFDMLTEASTGYYCRIMPNAQQTITLEVSADDYESTSVQATTGGATATVLDIQLAPETSGVGEAIGSASPVTRLERNVPNPFNPSTSLPFSLAGAGRVTIRIYDLQGREVTTLVDRHLDAGTHVARWDGRRFDGTPAASGVYLARLVAGETVSTQRMVLLQ